MEKKVLQAHNLTPQQMQELHQSQLADEVENDATGSEDSGYEFPSHEQHLVHAHIEMPEYDKNTGKKLSVGRVQKYNVKEFKNQLETNGFAGYEVKVLHDPSKGGSVSDGIKSQTAGGQSLGDRHHPDVIARLKGGEAVTAEEVKAEEGKIGKMTKPQLQQKYTELYGEAPAEEATVADLKKSIKEKIEFLQSEMSE